MSCNDEHCGCGHHGHHAEHHGHDHGECGCEHGHGHVHERNHEHGACCCGHEHGHERNHEHGQGECGCGHVHEHDHGECGCERNEHHTEHHEHGHGECGCGQAHEHDHGHDHDHDHEECGCGCDCHCGESHARESVGLEHPTFSYRVIGVDCPNCAQNVQNAVMALPSVEDARLVYATATLDVLASPHVQVTECKREVLATVRSCGEDLALSEQELAELEAQRSWFTQNREKLLMGLSAFALVAGLVTDHAMHSEPKAVPFYVLAAIAGLVYIAPMAWAALRRRTADMNVLMSIAVLGALAIGFAGDQSVFGDAAIVIFLDQVGEWLEGWSMRKTSGSVRELMDLAPSVAHVVSPEGTTVDVQTTGVEEGYTIRVLPGERVPLDGIIVRGSSSFNEAPITGESIPKDKSEGAEVFAGSLNSNAVVDIQVTADEDCTTLARIVSQVQGAQAQKAPYESFVNRFAAAYTPVVVVGALVLGVCVPLVLSIAQGGFDAGLWHDWVYRACSLLVVACPCALVISTPVSFVSALTRAAKNGVLVKGGAFFDIATHVTHVAMDKTGTLTTGSPTVTQVVCLGDSTAEEVLRVAASLEAASTHPLARAVVQEAADRGLELMEASSVSETAAQGVRGVLSQNPCAVGKASFVLDTNPSADTFAAVRQAEERVASQGATPLVVGCKGEAIGVVGVADTLRPAVPYVVAALESGRAGGHTRVVSMLTGDNQKTAEAIAKQAGIASVRSELLPEDKLTIIGDAQQVGGVVAMVGDGINDAPALAKADLGITVGAAASDTALEVADVALLSNDMKQLPSFFFLAERTMNVVRENIAFAIGVKVLVFVLVALGVAGMGAAVFADTGVALIVVLNGMRLMRASKLRW